MSVDEFRKLFDAEYAFVCRTLRRLGVQERDIQDVAQELFVLVHKALPTFDGSRAARPWLYAFVVRLAANYRKLRRHRVETDSDHEDARGDASESAAARDLVLRALSKLDDEKRTALVLFDLEGFDAQEIADMNGIPLNTVYSRVRLAREAFRTALAALGHEGGGQ